MHHHWQSDYYKNKTKQNKTLKKDFVSHTHEDSFINKQYIYNNRPTAPNSMRLFVRFLHIYMLLLLIKKGRRKLRITSYVINASSAYYKNLREYKTQK